MSIVYEEIEDEEKAIGRATKDEQRLLRELEHLHQTDVQSIANRLDKLLAVVQETDGAGNLTDPDEIIESLVCPLKHDVADMLRRRVQLKAELRQARDFLQAKVPRPRPVQD